MSGQKHASYVLGLNISHDATAVLVDIDGSVVGAVSEERITRQKYHETFPFESIKVLLQITGIPERKIERVAYNWRNIGGEREYRKRIFLPGNKNIDWANKIPTEISKKIVIDWFFRKSSIYRRFIRRESDLVLVRGALQHCGINTKNIIAYDHQLCHAASAYYSSPFKEALVVSLDGYGDDKSGGVYIGRFNTLVRMERFPPEVSAGAFYANVTSALGYKRVRHEGKITGLAALGDFSKQNVQLRRFFDLNNKKDFCRLPLEQTIKAELLDMIGFYSDGKYRDSYLSAIKEFYSVHGTTPQDLAAAAQNILEDVCVKLVEDRMSKYWQSNLALAGGVFANVKLNQKILETKNVKDIFIHPNMGDGGGAYGAAMLAVYADRKDKERKPINNVYWGPEYSSEDIRVAIDDYEIEAVHVKNIEAEIAERLAAGLVIGRFTGRMEYGPRALGNRSIFVQATNSEINDRLNNRLGRTEFMPFAPIVMEEYGSDIFSGFDAARNACRYMTITLPVKIEWREKIKAAVHVDDTARPQWVSREYNYSAYRILEEYNNITGIPVLINTSFNRHEEPIVCKPHEAISVWEDGGIDALAIGNFLIEH